MRFVYVARKTFLGIVRIYQTFFSPDHSHRAILYPYGFCRYYPSCSQYCREAILKHGILGGCVLTCLRIFRCNPWSKGGVDPVR